MHCCQIEFNFASLLLSLRRKKRENKPPRAYFAAKFGAEPARIGYAGGRLARSGPLAQARPAGANIILIHSPSIGAREKNSSPGLLSTMVATQTLVTDGSAGAGRIRY